MRTNPCLPRLGKSRWIVGPALTAALLAGGDPALGQSGDVKPPTPSSTTVPVIPSDASVERLFSDFLHYSRMGRFSLADAYAGALLAHPDLDPVEVMELANKDRKSLDTLLILIKNSTIGDNAARVLNLIEKGEAEKRKSADRILDNINKLGGDPQQEFYAIKRLTESGEYGIPHLVQTLLDRSKADLHPRIVNALPLLGKPAVNPLVTALSVQSDDVRLHLIRALGEIGYPQAVPYLTKLMADSEMPDMTRSAAAGAIGRIEQISGRGSPGTPEQLFTELGDRYYNEDDAVRADPRLDEANIWYWDADQQGLRRTVVPTRIFGQVMAMRCAEEALLLKNDHAAAISLWLAANIRREYRLGLNIESGDPNEKGDADATRPERFPRALYFTQAAGARYAHDVLDWAVRTGDSPVALGAIEALRITAGESSLVGSEAYKQPLVKALEFSDIVVRIRAALALGAALPRSAFNGADRVVPVLASALALSGQEQMIVVDGDETNGNRIAGILRDTRREVIVDTDFFRALERARQEFTNIAGLWIASDLRDPALGEALRRFRNEYVFAKTPVVVLSKERYELNTRELAEVDPYLEPIAALADAKMIESAYTRAAARAGRTPVDAALARRLALQAADTLRKIALNGRTVLDLAAGEPALIATLNVNDEELQVRCAAVLASFSTPTAQRAVAHIAMSDDHTVSLRTAAFGALADSAKNHGNLLEPAQVSALIALSREADDLVIRTSASQALGALNLATNEASEIVRGYYGG